jgi:hypothetical protein
MRCRHVGQLPVAMLKSLGIDPDAPIASFVKRLRCRRCGSASVIASRTQPPQARSA